MSDDSTDEGSADESVTKRVQRLDRLRDGIEDGEVYTSDELAAIALDKDPEDVTTSDRAYVSNLRPDLGMSSMADPDRSGNAKLYYIGDRPAIESTPATEGSSGTDGDTATVACQHCGDDFHPKGVKPHERHCPENPDNRSQADDVAENDDSSAAPETASTDAGGAVDTDVYRCGNCGTERPTEREVKAHQSRTQDCTGAEIERVEQTDDSETAASAADPAGDDPLDETDDEDDPALDPAVGAVPVDPDAVVDEADDDPVLDETDDLDEDDAGDVPAKDEYDGRHRVRREPSTVRDVVEADLSGRYLCLDCGFLPQGTDQARAAKRHDFRTHESYTDEDGEAYRQLEDVPADELAERWLLIYENVGSTWTHPKVHEARKNGIVHILEQADYFLDLSELQERVNEFVSSYGSRGLTVDQLTDDPGYLDELVAEGRIEQEGTSWGVDAERAAAIVTESA